MSNLEQAPQQDFDFWDYVTCSRCHLSFTPDNGGPPPVPFWVTECGHVVCNNHLRTDQSCAKCGQRDIQVAPLQRDMDPPMSNWFSSAPQALDTLAFTTRFQIESLASLVRYYKRKCAHQRSLIERMRPAIQENKDLRRALEGVQNETCQSQNYMEPSGMPNGNGKRQMLQISRSIDGIHANSSPRSAATPVGPDRLTLPPTHQQPGFTSRQHHSDDGPQPRWNHTQHPQVIDPAFAESASRPGSRRFTEQYAYAPSPARQGRLIPPQNLAYSQANPGRQAQERRQSQLSVQNEAHIPTAADQPRGPSALLRPSQQLPGSQPQRRPREDRVQMPPPSIPLGLSGAARQGPPLQQRGSFMPSSAALRGLPPAQATHQLLRTASAADDRNAAGADFSNFRAATPMLQTQRFLPPTPSGRQRFVDPSSSTFAGSSGSGLVRSGSTTSVSSGGQRLPFVPGG